MIGATAAAFLSHWRRSPLQLFTLLAGLALATALWSGVQAINAEARASYAAAAGTLGEGQFDQILPANGGTFAQEDWVALRRAGWPVSPVVEGRRDGIRIVGIEPLTAPGGLGPVAPSSGEDIATFLSPPGTIHGREDVLATLDLTRPGSPQPVVAADVAPGTAVTDIGVAQRLLGLEGRLTRLILAPGATAGLPPLAEIAPGLTLRPAEGQTDLAQLTDSFHLNLTAFGLLSFAVGIFIVQGAVGLAFAQRRGTVRTLRALGVPVAALVAVLAGELILMALVAGTAGVALGHLIAAALLPDVAASLRGLYGAEVAGTLSFRAGWLASGLALALAGAGIAGGRALWQVARMPVLAAGPEALARRTRWGVWAVAAAALLALAGVFALTARGLPGGFALLGCLMVGAALALPPVLAAILDRLAARARGPLATWFWADARQQLPALSLALMALMLAMAANVGVATMVSSFRLTFVAFLDQRLAPELYVQADSPEQAATAAEVAARRGAAVLPILAQDARLAGMPGDVAGMIDHPTYRENWRFLTAVPGAWDLLFAGEGAIINEQLHRRGGVALGDPLEISPGLTLPVVGVYGDYGNPGAQAAIAADLFRATWPEVAVLRLGLRVAPENTPALRAALEAEAGLPPSAVVDQAAVKAFSMSVFDRTFAVTGALNVLTLAVAGFAMLMSLLTIAGMRLPQLAPVWAMGVTRATLARAELGRAVALAALTGVLAVPVGLALAWALLAIVNVAAFGWKLPMTLFPLDYLRLLALAVVAGALAAALPALRLRRTPPARLLKVFADER